MGEEQSIDLDALLAEIRREAESLRAKLGPTTVPELEPPSVALAAVAAEKPSVLPRSFGSTKSAAHLRELTDPRAATFSSHRARLGPIILAAKRALVRLLTPIWNQQAAFNRATVDELGELREGLAQLGQSLDRRLLAAEDALARIPDSSGWGEIGFDYEAFEAAFRGSSERVAKGQARYLEYFPDGGSGPVMDLGCGRGEFLALLRERGIVCFGVDRDESAIAQARAAGLDARRGDLLDALASCADGSLGGLVSFQVIEHLSLPLVIRMISLAKAKLRPGGCFVAETVNPQSLIVFTRGWTLDPTHRQPLHPLTLRFLVDHAGFARSELVYSGEVDAEDRLEPPQSNGLDERNIARLNSLLFAPQDYAVVAWS